MDYKDEILQMMEHVVLEWSIVIDDGDMEKHILPTEIKRYYTLNKYFISDDVTVSQSDNTSTFNAYNMITHKVDTVSLADNHYYGITLEGTVDGDFTLGDLCTQKEVPDLSKYKKHTKDKLDTYRYRLTTVLDVAKSEWENCTLYELIDVAKNEYGVDLDADTVDSAVEKLTDIFTDITMNGHSTFVETRLRSVNSILTKLGDADDNNKETIQKFKQIWISLIRQYRDKALKALDAEEQNAKDNDDDQGIEEIEFIKQLLRDLPKECKPELDAANTCLNVMEYWPPIILPRPDDADIEKFISVELVKA